MKENKILQGEIYSPDNQKSSENEVSVKRGEFSELTSDFRKSEKQDISFLSEVCLPVNVELGHSRMKIKDILELGPGSVVQLDKLPDEPVELYVGDKPLAKGEVVVVGERLGVRITEIICPSITEGS
ncbi:MAG TPA: flagellar motor switch protein FliN [Terriglobales bacterium]|nr:flagellar motor switch protein FliN [Terriglobales bacterium]